MNDEIPAGHHVLLVAENPALLSVLRPAEDILVSFGLRSESLVVSADEALPSIKAPPFAVIVASADAALPGAFAAAMDRPVVRVPTPGGDRTGLALLCDPATGDLPAAGGSFATVAISEAGAKNAALFVVSVLALEDPRLWTEWLAFRQRQTEAVLASPPLSMD